MDPAVRERCDEILSWRRAHGGRAPTVLNDPLCQQSMLANHKSRLKRRCSKAVSAYPSGRQLNQDEVRYFEWCLSDAALQEENPEWTARESDAGQCGINTASDGSHGSRVPVTVASGCPATGAVAVQVNGGAEARMQVESGQGQRRQAELALDVPCKRLCTDASCDGEVAPVGEPMQTARGASAPDKDFPDQPCEHDAQCRQRP